jgi:hypothetical protein
VELSHTIRPTFDDPNVVSDAGVVPALRLGESAGLYDLLEDALTVDSPNATAKTTCVVGGMLADADSIDDLETRVEVNRGGPATACPTRSWRGSSTTTPSGPSRRSARPRSRLERSPYLTPRASRISPRC